MTGEYRLRAQDFSFGVSDQQRVGSSPGCDTCVLKQDALPQLLWMGYETVLE